MADVIVFERDKVLELLDTVFVSGTIESDGDLVFTTFGSDTVNLGKFDHADLTGLTTGDPHTQYALADGSRGSFATTAQGTKADDARPNLNSITDFDGGDNDVVEHFRITIDGTDSGTWPDRWRWQIRNGTGSYRYVTYLNEFGELRLTPAKHDTVSTRWFVIDTPTLTDGTARNTGVPIMELMDDRTNRNIIWAKMTNGDDAYHTGSAYVRLARVLVLTAAASVPANTPAGTVIVRTT
jgi:hypothetical protein